MSVSFFGTKCTKPARSENLFGICDDQNGTKAYTDTADNTKWIVIVKNESNKEVTFTAIDNCIIIYKPGTKDKESSCDGMLAFENSLYLVELKKQHTGGWISDAIGQLENTMKLLIANNKKELDSLKFKKAFACNKKHPHFTTIDNELNRRFFREYGFRIDVQAEIVIK